MTLVEIAELFARADLYALPIGFAFGTVYLQKLFNVFNIKTFGADLAAAATALAASAAISKATTIFQTSTGAVAILAPLIILLIWLGCLRLASPVGTASAPDSWKHKLSCLLGFASLFASTWFSKQLLALGTKAGGGI